MLSTTTTEGELSTLQPSGAAPSTRIRDAAQARSIVDKVLELDGPRSRVRSLLKGLVDGNPPYDPGKLKEQAQSFRSNVNFREAEAFLSSGQSSFYDIFNEAGSYALCRGEDEDERNSQRMSDIVTEEFDRLNRADDKLDYMMQLSQRDMVLFGVGPVMWEHKLDFRATPMQAENVLVPDRAPSYVEDWEECVILADYSPGKLFGWITSAGAAENGWDVEAVKQVLIHNAPKQQQNENRRTWGWEEVQHAIRNNDLAYSSQTTLIKVAHIYYREFAKGDEAEGKISHMIILRDSLASTSTNSGKGTKTNDSFLFRKLDEHKSWKELLCAFYYDKGDGTHHSVKGMGIKFYAALELKNRLKNSVVDAAFARAQLMFQSSGSDQQENMAIAQMGPYSMLPPGLQPITQTAVGGVLDAPMAVDRELLETLSGNLSMYRQNLQKNDGNPLSATEASIRNQQQSVLGKTQLNRYYAQLDDFWQERFRRAISSALTASVPGGKLAVEFQKRLKKRGVPRKFLESCQVKANRVAGQGSAFLRQAALQTLLGISGMLPETGRDLLIEDFVSTTAGRSFVSRYFPTEQRRELPTQQEWEANQENAIIKIGAPVLWTPEQNDVIHLKTHLEAASAVAESIQQNPQAMVEVAAYLQAMLQHVQSHLQSLSQDPTQQDKFKAFEEQAKMLEKVATELGGEVQKQMDQQRDQADNTQAAMTDEQIAQAKLMGEERRRDFKAGRDDMRKNFKNRQQMAIADLKMAQDIRNKPAQPARNGA